MHSADQSRHRVVINPTFAWRRIADELILVPTGGGAEDLKYVFSLNETAALVWELLEKRLDRDAICDRLVREFDVDPTVARSDVDELLDELAAIGAVCQEIP